MVELSGKTALVTGGGKRIGKAIVLALADDRVNVVVHYGASQAEAEETAGAVRGRGCLAWTVQADLGQPSEAAGLLPQAIEAAGPIDFLVNNASIFDESRLADFTVGDLAGNVQVNAMSPLQLARAFAAQGREGAIVNFLDARMTDYDCEHVAYHLSKRMLFSLTRMMAVEFAPSVRVNAVAPGLILPPAGEDQSYLEKLADTNPLRRFGGPPDVVEAALFLLRSDFVTGQVLYVDGGRHMRGKMYG